MDLLPENQEALDLYGKIKLLGADLVCKMVDRTYSKIEAENLIEKLDLIANTISRLGAQTPREE